MRCLFGIADVVLQIYAAYRAYESSNVSGSAQAWTIFTVCCMAVAGKQIWQEVDRHSLVQHGVSAVPAWTKSIDMHAAGATSVGAQTEPSPDESLRPQDPSTTSSSAISSTQTERSLLTQNPSVEVQTIFQKSRRALALAVTF